MHAALHQPPQVEVVGVEKRRDRDAKHIAGRQLLGERLGKEDPGRFFQFGVTPGLVPRPENRQIGQRDPPPGVGPAPLARARLVTSWPAIAPRAASQPTEVFLDQLARLGTRERDPVRQQVDAVAGIDEPREGNQPGAGPERIGQGMAVGMGTGEREEVVLGEESGGLGDQPFHHIGKGDPPFQLLGQHMPARVRGGLEAETRNPRALGGEFDQRAQLVEVDVGLQGADQRGVQPHAPQVVDRPQLGRQQRLAPQGAIDPVVQTVELQVDLGTVLEPGNPLDQCHVIRQSNAVGVDHHIIDRLGAGVFEDLFELRVQRGLAPRELQHLGTGFDGNHAVNRPARLLEGPVASSGATAGEAHGALQVAARGDFGEGDAGVLFVLGAEAAVVRTALVGLGSELGGNLPGDEEFGPVVPADIGADEILANSVGRAMLAKVDPAVGADHDLGGNEREALGAEALSGSQERVVAQLEHERADRNRS